MVEYKCVRCGDCYNKKYAYERHVNRKFKCKKGNSSPKKKIIYECEYCEKILSRKDKLTRHEKICKSRVLDDEEEEDEEDEEEDEEE